MQRVVSKMLNKTEFMTANSAVLLVSFALFLLDDFFVIDVFERYI